MSGSGRLIVLLSLVAALLIPGVTSAQRVDFTGEYAQLFHEDQPERGPGPEVGDYLGLPINEHARQRALAWDASLLTLPEWQCRSHGADYIVRGPQSVRIWKEIAPVTRDLISWNAEWSRASETYREIFMDGRPHPPEWAPHTWRGFSTGRWEGNMLVITTTHLKESYVRRNGIPRSDWATLAEYVMRRGDVLTWVTIINDPVYLTEPMIRTTEYRLATNLTPPPFPCDAVIEIPRPKGAVPHVLPGTADPTVDFAAKYGLPVEAARGGAETMYPEYRERIRRWSASRSGDAAPQSADGGADERR